MIAFRVLLMSVLVCLAPVAAAQSPAEDAAKRQAGTARYQIPTSKQCAVFQRRATLPKPLFAKDSLGRVSGVRNEYGQDAVIEYLGASRTPAAVIFLGQRVAFGSGAVPDAGMIQHLKARAILYGQVKKACEAPNQPTLNTECNENRPGGGPRPLFDDDDCGGGGGGGGIPSE